MKKNKFILCLLLFCIFFITACSSKKEVKTIVDENLSEDNILFMRIEYEYIEDIEQYYTVFSTLDNSGKFKIYNLKTKKDSEIIKSINDPIAMLLFIESVDDKEFLEVKKTSIDNLSKAYEKTFNIENKLDFKYKVLYGEYCDEGYNNYLFGYSYLNKEEYVPTKYYSSNSISSQIKDPEGEIVAEYLYSVFR